MKNMNWILILCVAVSVLGAGCGDPNETALLGDWWETYHDYDGIDVGPVFRWTFNSDGTGEMMCSTALLGDGCTEYGLQRFDWNVRTPGDLEIDPRPLAGGSDYAAVHWSYTIEDGVLEMTSYDALDYLTTLRSSRERP